MLGQLAARSERQGGWLAVVHFDAKERTEKGVWCKSSILSNCLLLEKIAYQAVEKEVKPMMLSTITTCIRTRRGLLQRFRKSDHHRSREHVRQRSD